MKNLKRIETLLILGILVLLNLVSSNSFFRVDLTGNDVYSLSPVSRDTLALLEDPMRVRVFYTADLPAPYNGVRQYLLDLLREYDGVGSDLFNYELVDVSTPEGKTEAQQYGLQSVEIQEIQSDEFQSRAVFMGAAVLYGNVVERVDRITTTSGMEYRLTTAMNSALRQVDALSGADGVTMTVYASPAVADLQIDGFDSLEDELCGIYERMNEDAFGRIEFDFREPQTEAEIAEVVEETGLAPLRWESRAGVHRGLLGVILAYGDRVERIPLEVYSLLFGGYTLDEPAKIEESLRQSLRSLVSTTERVAYATGFGELGINDYQQGAAPFAAYLSERYEVVPVAIGDEEIPAGIDTLIVNGPREAYTEAALYRIDQFIMGGGSILFLLDAYAQVVPTQQEMMAGAQPYWDAVDAGLTPMLEHYGVRLSSEVVLDEESYQNRASDGQIQTIFWAPVLSGKSINADHATTASLQDIIVLMARDMTPVLDLEAAAEGTADEAAAMPAGHTYAALLQSSERSWTVPSPNEIGQWIQGLPPGADSGRRDLAVLLEGSFESYFDGPVEMALPVLDGPVGDGSITDGEGAAGDHDAPAGTVSESSDLLAAAFDDYRSASLEPGRVLVIGTSTITTPQLLSVQSRSPNGTFLVNAVDYLNGMPEIARLRSKGVAVARIEPVADIARRATRWTNTIVVPLVVVLAGIIMVWRRRMRARRIRSTFAEQNDD